MNINLFDCNMRIIPVIFGHPREYKPIESDEQRCRYKDEFNVDYPVYRDLHAVIEKVSKKFAQLEERLREEARGSEEYQVLQNSHIHLLNV